VLREAGITRPFAGTLEAWAYDALDDTARAAAEIRRRSGIGAPAAHDGMRPALAFCSPGASPCWC